MQGLESRKWEAVYTCFFPGIELLFLLLGKPIVYAVLRIWIRLATNQWGGDYIRLTFMRPFALI
jgi:hypothetical protein